MLILRMKVEPFFIIYGANSWLGKATIDYLLTNLKIDNTNIIAISSSVKKLALRDNKSHDCYTITDILNKHYTDVIFFNYAFALKEQIGTLGNKKFIETNLQIRENAEKLIRHLQPLTIIYSSSGAAQNPDQDQNPYGYLKREDEVFYRKLAQELGCKLLIPRIYNLAGPYINKLDVYALGNFIKQSLQNNKIKINAESEVIRDYIHVFDLVEIIVKWASDDNSEKFFTFDTGINNNLELKELAQLIKNITNNKTSINRASNPKLHANIYVGNIKNQETLTSRYKIKLKNIEKCIEDTYDYLLKENKI